MPLKLIPSGYTTTSSPIVASSLLKGREKKVDESQPTTSKGEEPAPTVEKPEYTGPIGTAGTRRGTLQLKSLNILIPSELRENKKLQTVEIPEYTEPIRTVGQEEPPTVTIPEYTEPIGTAGQEETLLLKPEYTNPWN